MNLPDSREVGQDKKEVLLDPIPEVSLKEVNFDRKRMVLVGYSLLGRDSWPAVLSPFWRQCRG